MPGGGPIPGGAPIPGGGPPRPMPGGGPMPGGPMPIPGGGPKPGGGPPIPGGAPMPGGAFIIGPPWTTDPRPGCAPAGAHTHSSQVERSLPRRTALQRNEAQALCHRVSCASAILGKGQSQREGAWTRGRVDAPSSFPYPPRPHPRPAQPDPALPHPSPMAARPAPPAPRAPPLQLLRRRSFSLPLMAAALRSIRRRHSPPG